MKSLIVTLIIVLSLASASNYAGGFQLNEHGAKAMAMGGAYTAVANDPSAIYWNGAGLTALSGTHFMVGTSLIIPNTTFRGVSPDITNYDMKQQIFFPSHFFVSHSIDKDWAIGLGFTVPFGLGTKWGDDWIGKYLAIETELQTFTVMPTVAYRVNDYLSLSASFVYSFADVTITRKIPQSPFDGDAFVRLEGDDKSAFGYNFGLMVKPIEKVSIGVSFHSQIEYSFEGTAVTTGAQQLIDAKRLPNDDIKADLTTPFNLAFGIAVDVTDELKISADYQRVGWSSYDSLKVEFNDPAFTDLASPREYEDSYIIRLGASYKYNDNFSFMGGIYYDNNPVNPDFVNPSLPDANRLGFSFGLEAKLTEKIGIQASYLYIRSEELTVTNSRENYVPGISPFNGTYNSFANIFSVGFLYSL